MKQLAAVVLALTLGFVTLSVASSIKVWSNSESLTSQDLNANFAHIHNTMVGSHGARLVNTDVSPTAAIAHTKMATPALLPKAWAVVYDQCDAGIADGGGNCTVGASSRVTSVTRTSSGYYDVTLGYTPVNAQFAVIVSGRSQQLIDDNGSCQSNYANNSAPHIKIRCYAVHDAGTDSSFSFIVMDDSN
jgi:hypothetical protein